LLEGEKEEKKKGEVLNLFRCFTHTHTQQWGQLVVTIPKETKVPNFTGKSKTGKQQNPKVEGKQKKLQQTPIAFCGN